MTFLFILISVLFFFYLTGLKRGLQTLFLLVGLTALLIINPEILLWVAVVAAVVGVIKEIRAYPPVEPPSQ